MKRLVKLCSVMLLLALVLPVTAHADVIYEPFDSFYERYRSECLYVGRNYTAIAPSGTITLYESPQNPAVEAAYPNGTALYVSYKYQDADGVLWACCDNWEAEVTGWAPMEYLELIYDGQSFFEEYGDQYIPVKITLDAAELTGKTVYFWEYPGSRDYIALELSADYRPDFQESYTDDAGDQWLRCGYYMGIRGMWVNRDNPTADFDTLFPDAPEETEAVVTAPRASEVAEEISPAGSNVTLTVILAVAAVVAVTAALLIVLKKKNTDSC